jgi:hypothetical protein
MLALAFSQPLLAQCRGGPEDTRHCVWSLVHRSVGWLSVIGGLVNIPLGLEGESNFFDSIRIHEQFLWLQPLANHLRKANTQRLCIALFHSVWDANLCRR